MSEMRYDWLADRWVIYAPQRAARPDEYMRRVPVPTLSPRACPFCPGNEDETPTAELTLSDNPVPFRELDQRSDAWQVRVVPNRYPAVAVRDTVSACDCRYEPSPWMVDGQVREDSRAALAAHVAHCDANESVFFRHAPVTGGHEVIVEAPFHAASLTEVPDAIVRLAFEAYRRRLLHWGREPGMQYGVVFKNVGSDAGASLLHSHSQLLAMQFTPPEIVRLLGRLDQYRQQHDVCYFCDMLQSEREAGSRVIAETDTMVAFCPYAGRTPYLIWVLPKRHQSRFERLEMDELSDIALLTKRLLRCVEAVCPNAAYNYVIHTQPFHADCESICHWRLEIFPRLIKIAGFEWGTDCFINPVLTELAASELRTAYAAANAIR